MAFCHVLYRAPSIRKDTGIYVLLPDEKGPFPVLYLLHGMSDDYTKWHRHTSIERYMRSLPLIVVMPDGHRSRYCNDPRPDGMAYEDHIVKDVVGFVDRTFPTIPRRSGRAIAGLSMGGYGSLMLAMKHPDMFSVVSSHSGGGKFARHPSVKGSLRAELLKLPRHDCFALARKLKKSKRRLAIRMDCGTEDRLIEGNREFHAHLQRLGIPHEYAEYPGAHNWDYWDAHIPETLAFVMKRLPAARALRK